MIKTDQNADYYQGAKDCLDYLAQRVVGANTGTQKDIFRLLISEICKLENEFHERMAADCDPYRNLVPCSICKVSYPSIVLDMLVEGDKYIPDVCPFCGAKRMMGWEEGQPCPFSGEMNQYRWEDAMRFRKSQEDAP